jgi:hypothetical protein
VAGANVILDYAKIRIVVEDRRSAIGGLIAAVRFLARNPSTAGGLYLLNTVTCAALLAAWAAIAPSAGAPAGLGVWLALALGQGFIVARLATKLHFVASQTALFQRRLAHERFTSAPVYRWPDAPIVETPGSRCIRRTRAIYVYLAVYLAPDGARSMTSGRSRSVSVPMASKPEGKRLALRTYAVRSTYSTRDSEPGAGSGMDPDHPEHKVVDGAAAPALQKRVSGERRHFRHRIAFQSGTVALLAVTRVQQLPTLGLGTRVDLVPNGPARNKFLSHQHPWPRPPN